MNKKYVSILTFVIVNTIYANAVISISGHGQFSAKHYYYNTKNNSDKNEPFNALQRYQNCFYGNEIIECIKKQTVMMLDNFARNNDSIVLNDYIQINKNSEWNERPINSSARSVESVDELLRNKIVDLAESRSIQIKFPILSKRPEPEPENGRQFQNNIDDFDAGVDEGRKKKGGGKHGGYLVGAMALAAVLGQLALGKVAFLAGAAILLAKIALLLSLLSGLKKHSGGTGTGEHVVLAADHGHSSYNAAGWQRSIDEQAQNLAFRSQIQRPGID